MTLAANIRRLRRSRDMTQADLAKAIGVGATSVSNWERGDAEPLMGRVRAMAKLFRVPISEITGEESELVVGYSYASCPTAPLYGKIAAGEPIEKLPVDDELFIPPHVKREHPRAFYLEVKGESMNRVLPNGCYVLIDPDSQECDGDVMAVTVNGSDATIKRVFRGADAVTLAPESFDSRFEDERIADPEIVTPIGRVVWFAAKYGRRL